MEELQDAIEDAQYVTAISSVEDGPRPVLPWEIPEEEQLASWKETVIKKHEEEAKNDKDPHPPPAPFTFEWTLSHALGFFLFSAYLKEVAEDHVRINFMEEVLRWKNTRGRFRAQKTSFIVSGYLAALPEGSFSTPTPPPSEPGASNEEQPAPADATIENGDSEHKAETAAAAAAAPPAPKKVKRPPGPPKTEISEYNLVREPPFFGADEIKEIVARGSDPTKTCVGVGGEVLDTILSKVERLRNAPGYNTLSDGVGEGSDDEDDVDIFQSQKSKKGKQKEKNKQENGAAGDGDGDAAPERRNSPKERSLRNMSLVSNELPETLFDEAEVVVAESVREEHWSGFRASEQHAKLLNFLWFQDRTVVEEDFFVMRVLGRGGFGLVTACKKGTSGKLYAMKVMNKKRIKIKKAEQLTLNEQKCLADIDSPFVVNLKYSFQSQTDVFLILDLMTGGDLSYHLSQKGCFPKKECLYYGARIMLGLQALHDKGYVYRDLKPENCLLGEDGRVKLTDLGLATKVTPNLHGAAGTRGYWAPEMLRRDEKGKRKNYGHMVDWFSFGCCLAEFISGTNPFRSQEALNFGLDKGKKSKEKAIDCATLEMHPVFERAKFNEQAEDICRRLLDKNEATRLGVNGCDEIMSHPWFRGVNWEDIISDKMEPPYIPPKDVNAASQSEIGTFAEDKTFHTTVLSDKDEAVYNSWDFTNTKAFAAEVIEFLIYERETGEPLLPIQPNASCCCTII